AINAAAMVSRPGEDDRSMVDGLTSLWLDHFASDPSRCHEGAVRVRGDMSEYANLRCWLSDPGRPLSLIAEDTASLAQSFLDRVTRALSPPPRTIGKRALAFADPNALITNDGLVRILRRQIDLRGIRESPKALRIATTNWRTGKLRVFANADLTDRIGHAAIQASTTFPGLPPVWIDGDPYVDGGYVLNTPLQLAIAADADELHVIFMDPDIKNIPVQ